MRHDTVPSRGEDAPQHASARRCRVRCRCRSVWRRPSLVRCDLCSISASPAAAAASTRRHRAAGGWGGNPQGGGRQSARGRSAAGLPSSCSACRSACLSSSQAAPHRRPQPGAQAAALRHGQIGRGAAVLAAAPMRPKRCRHALHAEPAAPQPTKQPTNTASACGTQRGAGAGRNHPPVHGRRMEGAGDFLALLGIGGFVPSMLGRWGALQAPARPPPLPHGFVIGGPRGV